MKKSAIYLVACATGLFLMGAIKRPSANGLEKGTPQVQSISALAFGPDGVLFIGDSKSATVFAVNTNDTKKNKQATPVEMQNIDQKIAAALGTQAGNITITDMAVNPVSKKLYLSVQHSDGTPVLLTIDGDKIAAFPFKDVAFSAVALNNSPAEDAKDQRGRSLRVSTISDLGYADGKLLVSGLSNHQFSSSFKSIPFPFTDKQDESTLEIYHAAHGRYETAAPIRTFTTAEINGKKYLVASYTCTPLVLFPMDELKPGMHVKGRTVAEMGSGNTPIDMISLNKNTGSYLVMANTARPVAKVDYKSIAAFEGTLTEPVKGTAGVAYTTMPDMSKVLQMDKLDENQLVVIQKKESGAVDLLTANDIK
ncbi:hypothetical protein EXU57_20565 [Segetibacter sp. 3557_3]|uniref:hypothetical protein n=1 Tax=Segetibacter sp. 3557_3 TaxID=2547429 RepID=UPI0010584ADB|nr:hypothetical protein [Segetibacter sp. 3557_3]TDH21331.1 hypothetical protein EXU57_20565 [Segetibacter sp. 3557_3]